MSPEQKELLNVRHLPARLTVAQTAYLLGVQPHDVPVLVSRGLLKPLGNPRPNAVKHFAAADISTLRDDRRWLARASDALHHYWRKTKPSDEADYDEAAGQ